MSKRQQYQKPATSRRKTNFSITEILDDNRFKLTAGLITLVFSLVLFVSFCSYFWTGRADQSTVESLWRVSLSDSGREVLNWMGIFGAILAYFFIFKWFGIASFLLIPLLFRIGYFWVSATKLFSGREYAKFVVFWLLWTSMFFGYITILFEGKTVWAYLCGGIGLELALFFNSIFGGATILVLLLTAGIYAIFNFDLQTIEKWRLRFANFAQDTGDFADSVKDQFRREQKPFDESGNFIKTTEKKPFPFTKKENPNNTNPNNTNGQANNPTNNNGNNTNNANNSNTNPFNNKVENGTEIEFNLTPPIIKTPPNNGKVVLNKNSDLTIDDRTDFTEKTIDLENPVIIHEDLFGEPESPSEKIPAHIRFGNYDPKKDLSKYEYPHLDLLQPPVQNKLRVTREELEANKEKIVETLSHFNISIDTIKATVGPTVTLYEIVPQAGVKISKIKNLEDDIALSLSALGIRIIAPIPGRGTIGIEVPNKNREVVPVSSLFATEKFQKSEAELPIVLGKTISNEVFITDLAKMPHLLMAGATGQGKSVGLNVILTSLLYRKHPAELKLVLVDPKKVELTLFNRIEKHFLAMLPGSEEAIITDTKKVVHTLNSLCIEMDVRYGLLKDASCRNIKEYNEKFTKRMLNPDEGHRYLPYIVLVIDELADLMMTAGKEVETPIARLAQLARAIGIHLIVATQRPSVNVITGIIKANFPARLSFKVASKVDSRTILDTGGADQLIGQGDMLLSNGSDIIRLQCAFVATDEVEQICDFVGRQQGYATPYLLPEFEDENGDSESKVVDLTNRDALFNEAARLIVLHQQGSTSLIQRKLNLGYNRAGRLIDQLEAAGVVGAFEGSKARKVLVDESQLEELLRSLI
jgi:S-DNA-T family DNA segregation ATPase FtsK/SpoIIIE